MADLDVTLTSVTIPTNTSATLTVYEDVGDDGSGSNTDPNGKAYDNSASTSLSDGTTSYTLSGFDAASGNAVWWRVEPDNSDIVSTAEIEVDLSISAATSSGTTVSVPVDTTTAAEPGITVTPGATTASVPVGDTVAQEPPLDVAFDQFPSLPLATLSAVEPGVTIGQIVALATASLAASEPPLAVRTPTAQTATVPVEGLTAVEPPLPAVVDAFLTNGARASDDAALGVTELRSTHKELTITWRADVDNLSVLRDLQPGAGDLRVIDDANGEWETVPDSGGTAVDVALAPPSRLRPPLEPGTFYVRSYREQPGRAGFSSRVTARFVRETPRDPPSGLPSESAASDEWLFDFETGAIATDDVRRAAQAGQDRASLELGLTPEQAEIILTVPNQVDAVSEERVPDGDDFVRDNTENDVQTVTINRPADFDPKWWPDDGDYVVTDWRITDFGPPRVLVELDVRLASGSLSV